MAYNSITNDISLPQQFPSEINLGRYFLFLKKACENKSVHQIIFSFTYSCSDPLQWLKQLNNSHSFQYYWEKPECSYAIAASGSILEISAGGTDRFNSIQNQLKKARNQTIHYNTSERQHDGFPFVGGFSFFDDLKQNTWKNFGAASFYLPCYTLVKNDDHSVMSLGLVVQKDSTPELLHQEICKRINQFFNDDGTDNSLSQNGISPNRERLTVTDEYQDWVRLVNKAKKKISNKALNKVVVGRLVELELPPDFDKLQMLNSLRSEYPNCCTFMIKNGNSSTFIGSSPERLLSASDNTIRTEALAGSKSRSNNDREDKQLEDALLASKKDREEHRYVLNGIKNLLAPYLDSLKVADQPEVKKLANVQHLYAPIEGVLKQNVSPLSLISQLHPTPAVGGTPRSEALAFIRQHEAFERGWFAAPVGWINTDNSADFTVAIRSGLIDNGSIKLFAGCGIVADSDPAAEWEELNLKFMPLLSALNYD